MLESLLQHLESYAVAAGRIILFNPWFYLGVAVILVLEHIIPARRDQRLLSAGFAEDLLWFGVDGAFRVALVPAYAALLATVYERYLSALTVEAVAAWPAAAAGVFSFVMIDFLGWFHHWVRHKVTAFWYFHTVHHSQREMNLFTDLRVHVVERLVALTLTFIPLAMLGVDFPTGLYIAFAITWYTRLYHANIRTNYGFLKHVMVTPQSHRIHHSIEPRHQDKNFGVVLTVWDRLFGTLHSNYDEYPNTGVADDRFPAGRSKGLLGALRRVWGQFWFPFGLLLPRRRPVR
jgi:sterol desaturase/sphingolipid hydroxylase (fatty acid hydroxylase superfamily)